MMDDGDSEIGRGSFVSTLYLVTRYRDVSAGDLKLASLPRSNIS